MHRNPSPLLHDYKQSEALPPKKSQPLRWFAVGLGLPLIVTGAFLLHQKSLKAPTDSPVAAVNTMVATDPSPSGRLAELAEIEEIVFTESLTVQEFLADHPEFHPPLSYPQPVYDAISVTVSRGDTLDQIFRRNDLSISHLAQIIRLPEAANHLRILKPGDEIEIEHDDGQLISLYRDLELTSGLKVTRDADRFEASIVERPIDTRRRIAYGLIESSLFESADDAGLSDNIIMNIAGIFAWDVDFVLDIRTDDNYYVIYEEIWQDGEYVADGDIVAAEFNNNGRTHTAVRFIDKNGNEDYFTPDGHSVRKAFIRAPVDFTRISSRFNPRRKHPILNTIRAHRGVDYAAPSGTAIKAAGDGKVIFRGVKGGYGNAIIVQHGGNITTLYAHMSGFAKAARVGRRVKQGQTIGFVGRSGLATAPHLHYEYRLNGVHRNPRTVSLPQADPIKDEYMQDFLITAEPILEELQEFKQTRMASLPLE